MEQTPFPAVLIAASMSGRLGEVDRWWVIRCAVGRRERTLGLDWVC